ncbi:hypothetical protein B6D29_03990 [Microgenomates bacterium UTCPR1]|nr:metal-sulfur cluster assembly factor [Patescibacteria group bacterium]OQY65367.1 MAG: hypothetical protein B6D29_03990 [Microgenomates bacterium UTCPR1]
MKKLTKEKIVEKLKEVLDPELNISIVDLGLVYNVTIEKATADKKNKVIILMTLTTIGCPLISMIEEGIYGKLNELGLKKEDVVIELTFDPPWSTDKMSEKAKVTIGILD